MTPATGRPTTRNVEFLGGVILASTAVLTLIVILHHPVLHGRHGLNDIAVGIRSLAVMDRLVHGALMVILGVQTLGFLIFSAWLGFRNPASFFGFVAFAAGVVVMVIPATLDGFVTPDLASTCLKTQGGCAEVDAGAFRLAAAMVQDFTKVALIAMSTGTGCWSLSLLFRKGALNRAAGIVGFICAAVPASILLFSSVYLQPSNLAEIIACHVIWSLIAASLMVGSLGDKTMAASADGSRRPE